ncbi:hypothetical protein HGRIS_002270 [Hohenbuehelia grisea]|uniref:Amidohydrolase 3 domain-containing protein n=1 Tax=Hohenbuehelia grisea TaxID=104357 RepID=A0ABR3JL71_9AGAR
MNPPLRQRHSTTEAGGSFTPGKEFEGIQQNAQDDHRETRTKTPYSRMVWILGTSAILAIGLARWYPRYVSTGPLPETYALCTPEANKIYTVDDITPQVQCIVVDSAFIVDTGDLEGVKQRWADRHAHGTDSGTATHATRSLPVYFLKPGQIVVPGLIDSHAHILEYGASQQLPLDDATSVQDVVLRVRNFILANPEVVADPAKVILGGGWDHTFWPQNSWPTSEDLDADPVIRGRPVILQSRDCHALWLSETALNTSLPLPLEVDGGIIVRDTSGRPTGVFLDNAQSLVKQPVPSEDDLVRRFQIAVQHAHAAGLTSIHDAGLDPMSLRFYKGQSAKGNLPIRVYGMTYFDENDEYWGNTTKPLIGTGNGRLSTRSVKIFADGALRTGGAALYEPYENSTSNGFMRLPDKVLFETIPRFLRDGWQVNVHAIGDRANGLVLDAFEAALKDVDVSALRPRLEHAQIMTESDMTRLGKLGVIASVQPTHVISDMWYAQDKLGPERVKGLYAFRSIIDRGARLTLGSDFPVESLNPLATFYAAITRTSIDGTSPHGPGGWFPEQRLTRAEALKGMTVDPAYASFMEHELGSLVPGKRADFVVLSQDIMSISPDKILDTKVIATAIDGKVIHGRVF